MKLRWIAIALTTVIGLASTYAWAAQEAGDKAFTISGTGASDKDFNTNTFGTTIELGWFLTNEFELGLRQSVNVLALDNADDHWSGASRGFADYHFGQGTVVRTWEPTSAVSTAKTCTIPAPRGWKAV